MTAKTKTLFGEMLDRLNSVTKNCRPDMHEPDEQEIYAEFGPNTWKMERGSVGRTSFDNACCGEMSPDMGFWLIKRHYYEDGSYREDREWFNLACIVALARLAPPEKADLL